MKYEQFVKPDEIIIELIRAGAIKIPDQYELDPEEHHQEEVLRDQARFQAIYLRALRAELARPDNED